LSNNDNNAFNILKVDTTTGMTTLEVHKGILGPLARQLQRCPKTIKGSDIVKRLGQVLSDCGDVQYEDQVQPDSIDQHIIVRY